MRSVTRVAGWTLLLIGAAAIASGAVLALPYIEKAFSSELPEAGELIAFVSTAIGVGILSLSYRLLRQSRSDPSPEPPVIRTLETPSHTEPTKTLEELPFEDWGGPTLAPLVCPCYTFLVVYGSPSFRAGVGRLVGVSTDRIAQAHSCPATEEYVNVNPHEYGVIVAAPNTPAADFLDAAEYIRRNSSRWAVIMLREAGSNVANLVFPGVDSVIETGGSRLILRDAMDEALARLLLRDMHD